MRLSPEQWNLVKDLYEAALECDSSKLADFLHRNTADELVKTEVRRLLAEHNNVGSFLSTPAFADYQILPHQAKKRFAPGEVLAERFRIITFIAAGGMGEVYEAEDLTLKENLAIKTIRPEVLQQNNALARFKREVQLARKVTHANICRVFDLFWHKRTDDDGESVIAFVSMELLRGETLAERIRRGGRFTADEAMPLIDQIASGLEAAHRAGVVHRDLKPGNVILVPERDENQIRSVITDFGLALRTGVDANRSLDLSATQTVFGTPAYMAPEQIEGKEVTKLADIYALGLIIYEMVTGEHAFPADTPLASAAKRLSEPIVSPKRLAPELSDIWDETIVRCLHRNPTARYSSAMEVVRALSEQARDSFNRSPVLMLYRHGRLARFALIAALFFAIVGTVYELRTWSGKGRATTVHAAIRPSIAVLGFKNLSGKTDVAWISPALSQMLGTELTAGENLRVIPSEEVTHGKIDLALTDEDSLGRDSLMRVRNNMGSDFVVLGSFLDIRGQLRIDLSLQNALAGETISNISESGPEQNLPELAIRAGRRLRHTLGVVEPSADDIARTKASQSSSLEATRLYSGGLQKLHSFDCLGARDLLERAIVEDPKYALAHSALAEAWRSLGYGDKSAAEAKSAMDLSGSLSRENVLTIEAQYRNSRHENAREAEIYKTLFNFYPDNLEYGLSLAESQFFNVQFQEANSTLDTLKQLPSPQGDEPRIDKVRAEVAIASGDYKKALSLAENVELRARQRGARRLTGQALEDQCTLLSRLGDSSRASAACDKSRVIFSDIGDLAGESLVLGLIARQSADLGDLPSGRTANERQIALLKKIQDDSGLGWAMNVAGELSADSGDYERALKEYSEALNLYQRVGYQSGVISSYGNVGYVNSLKGNLTDAVANYEQAIVLTRRTNSNGEMDLWMQNLAEALLDKGDVQGATKQLEEGFKINRETGDKRTDIYLHTTRSKLLLAKGKFDESRSEAELAIKSCIDINDEEGANEKRLLLAQVDISQNQSQIAAETLRKALFNPKTKLDEASQIEARTILMEALLTTPYDESKRKELGVLARIGPNTQNVGLRLAANLQIARSWFALGDRAAAMKLLEDVISESKRLGYEAVWLKGKLARADMELESRAYSGGRTQIEEIAKQAEGMGLILIANQARSLLKRSISSS